MEAVKIRTILTLTLGTVALSAGQTPPQIKEIRFKQLTAISAPAYELVIRNDGSVEYIGHVRVKQEGRRTSQISQTDFNKLVRKIEKIRFFNLKDQYDDYPLGRSEKVSHAQPSVAPGAAATEATAERTIITDLPTQIVTVVAKGGTKSVADYLGAPKGLFELEQLILDVSRASQWTGFVSDVRDVPYYDSFPLNKRATYRALVEHYSHSGDKNAAAAGYTLMFMNNSGIEFELKAPSQIDLAKFDGYIVDATGHIKKTEMVEPEFVLTDIRRVRRYLSDKALKY